MLVAIDDNRFTTRLWHRDRDNLFRQPAALHGSTSLLLAEQGEGVLVLARNAASLGDIFGGLTEGVGVPRGLELRVREAPAERGISHRGYAARVGQLRFQHDHRRTAHAFDTPADEYVALA